MNTTIIGKRFERLTVLGVVPRRNGRNRNTRCVCQCACGTEKVIDKSSLLTGHTRSCGCLKIEQMIRRQWVHGHSKSIGFSPTYSTWANMMQRCGNPKLSSYPNYGGRGIEVCKRWSTFTSFLADMGERPAGKSIERKNNDGHYEPENCVWATRAEQNKNKRKVPALVGEIIALRRKISELEEVIAKAKEAL